MKPQKLLLTLALAGATAGALAAPLTVDTYVAGEAGFHVTSSLIKGEKEMVLVDGQFSQSEAHRLVAHMLETGLTLRYILITHAHPDHYFGLDVVLEAFPGTPVLAAADVAEDIKVKAPESLAYWKPIYKANLTSNPVQATALMSDELELEGETIKHIAIGRGDTAHTSMFYVPSAGSVIAGDVAYKDVHLWTAETDNEAREGWGQSLDELLRLNAAHTIPGHMQEESDTATEAVVRFNQGYLRHFNQAVDRAADATDIEAYMSEQYPDLALPVILSIGAGAAVQSGEQ